MLRRYEALHEQTTGLLREGIARGEVRPCVDGEWEARALVGFPDGIRLQWLYSDRQLDLGEAVRRYVELLVERVAAAP